MASKKQQKAGFPLPNPIDGWPLIDVCLKIPDAPEYRRAFLGHINQLAEWFIWEKSYLPGDVRARDAAQIWRRVLFDHLHIGDDCMSGCCDDPPALYRYASDGTLERSTDGGATWDSAPGFDPRFNSPQFPPASGDDGGDKKCLTATGAALLMKEQVADQLTDDMARYTLSQLINDWLKTVTQDGGNILEGLVTIIANQSFAVGVAALRAALTDPVWNTVKCILYCRIKDNASFDEAGWQAVKSDISSQISGIASLFLQQLVNILGPVGMTNLARSGGATEGDCSDCCPGCNIENWAGNWTGNVLSIVGDVVTLKAVWDGTRYIIGGTTNDPDLCCHLAMGFTVGGGAVPYAYIVCGLPIDGGNITSPLGNPDECSWFITTSPSPFTAVLTFSA